MKMRKKLAALLAAAMIASVMPMTAFAASENRVSKVVKVSEDYRLTGNESPTLRIKVKDGLATDEAFYITLDGANWGDEDASDEEQLKVAKKNLRLEKNGNLTLENDFDITFDGDDLRIKSLKAAPVDITFVFTLDTFVEDGEATIEVDGNNTPVDSGVYVFAKTSDDYSIELIVDEADDFANNGEVAEITIKEPFKGAFGNSDFAKDNADGKYKFTIELRDSDFEFFEKSDDKAVLKGKRGFAGLEGKVEFTEKDEITITLPKNSDLKAATSIGEFTLENVWVKAKKNAAKGEVKATARNVDGKLLDGNQNIVVANYSDFKTTLKMKKDYEVLAGREVEVEFTLAENIKDSLLNNRKVEFSVPKGVKLIDVEAKAAKSKHESGDYKGWTDIEVDDSSNKYDSFEFDKFERDPEEDAEYNFKATLLVSNTFDKEEIILSATGNALTEDHEVVAAKVIKPVEVEVTPMDVKVGLRKQTGGKIVIKETVKEAILRNYTDEAKNSIRDAEIEILIDDGKEDGLKITDADIKVTDGDLLLDLDAKVISGGTITIPVKRESTKPSTIEITNIEVTADRSVPEGKYDIKVGGNALSKNTEMKEFYKDNALRDDVYGDYYMDPVAVKEFINITTKNTEDFTGVTAATVSFVLNSNQYLVNGVAKEMDAVPFVKDGRTMVPVRYVATALGIDEDKVVWDQATQTVTVLAEKVIQVKLGSKTMVINGANVPMTAAAELVSNRTFVPVAEIARALGVNVEWDDASKTATFNPQGK